MSDVNVIQIDDVIPRLYQNQIEAEATSPRMAWFFNTETGRAVQGTETSYGGFSNTVFHANEPVPPSPMTALLLPLLYTFCDRAKLPFSRLLRIRLGLFQRTAIEALHHNPHVDFYQPHFNALYYVNDADGDTFIFDQTSDQVSQEESLVYTRERRFSIATRVSPRKGRMIGFDGRQYHASMHPMQAGYRIAIAFSFL